MLTKAMHKMLNDQIAEEMNSSYIYLAMSAWLKSQNHDGCAHWFSLQAREEWGHAMKIYGYVYDRRGVVTLEGVKKPQSTWKNPLDVFQAALAHEEHITACFDKLVAQAQKDKDNASLNFLQWFVTEQVEEEGTVDGIIHKIKMVGDNPVSFFMIDRYLGERS